MILRGDTMSDDTAAFENAGADEAAPGEPTQAEIVAWVALERARRKAWLEGPSAEERAEYADRLRHRRLSDTFDMSEQRIDEWSRRGLRSARETQLAAEGALALFYKFSRRSFAELVRAGREWEEETALPTRRRRVPLDDDLG
jgi:hypothetical protein